MLKIIAFIPSKFKKFINLPINKMYDYRIEGSMASDFNANSSFNFFNDTFKNINQKKNEYNDEISNNFYVNDADEFIEFGDFSSADSKYNVSANEDINIFSFQEESFDSSSYTFEDEGSSFFDDLC